MTVASLGLAPVGETTFPPRIPFFISLTALGKWRLPVHLQGRVG
jgi:hypothetical protein